MNPEVIILDTNIWISYILSQRYHILVGKILENNLHIVTCSNLINEISDVLQRKKFKKYINKKDIKEAVNIHLKLCRFIDIDLKSDYLTDKKDNYLIDLYKAAKATQLVSGDKQLLVQASKFGVNTITLKQFETQIT